jgi:hypothetical protein
MSELLSHRIDNLAGDLLGRALCGQTLRPDDIRALAARLQSIGADARRVEGTNIVPFNRSPASLREVFPEARL